MSRIRIPRSLISLRNRPRTIIIMLFLISFLFYLLVSNIPSAKKKTPGKKLGMGLDATFKTETYYFNRQDTELYDITIVTQVSVDRLERLAWMADKWRAPISAAVYIRNDSEVDLIANLIRGSYAVTQFVDIHLLWANNTRYPINTLRNLAIKNAETEWVLLMDADFIPPLYLYKNIVNYTYKVPRLDNVAFVVPSFASSLNRFSLPDKKEDLVSAVKKKTITPTNLNVCPKCHTPTNYTRWYQEDETYEVKYQWIYEPYLVFRKNHVELFDERLKGYGFDKNSQIFGMAVKGFQFIVIPDAWIVHMNHPKEVWEGTDSYDEQMWDSLKIVCQILPETKLFYDQNPEEILFGEPTKEKCYSRDHW